jgi:hypothetical protein
MSQLIFFYLQNFEFNQTDAISHGMSMQIQGRGIACLESQSIACRREGAKAAAADDG